MGTNRTASSLFLTFNLVMESARACESRGRNEGRDSSVSRLTSRAWLFSCLTKERYEKINRKTRDTYHANAKEQRAHHPHANRISLFKVLKQKLLGHSFNSYFSFYACLAFLGS